MGGGGSYCIDLTQDMDRWLALANAITNFRIAVAQWLRSLGRSLVRSQLVSLEFFIDINSFR